MVNVSQSPATNKKIVQILTATNSCWSPPASEIINYRANKCKEEENIDWRCVLCHGEWTIIRQRKIVVDFEWSGKSVESNSDAIALRKNWSLVKRVFFFFSCNVQFLVTPRKIQLRCFYLQYFQSCMFGCEKENIFFGTENF